MLLYSKLLTYEWFSDQTQPCFRADSLEIHYIDTHFCMFSFNPIKGLIEGLQRFKEDFDFFDLNATLELLKNRWKNGTLNTPEVDLDEAVILLCKSFSSNIKQKNSQ